MKEENKEKRKNNNNNKTIKGNDGTWLEECILKIHMFVTFSRYLARVTWSHFL